MDTRHSSVYFLDPESPSTSEVAELSQAQYYRTLTKIENLTYRIGYLSTFMSAAEETLLLLNSSQILFFYFSHELVALTEAARKTLESSKVAPYLWASCPEKLAPHKRAYLELLKALQSKAGIVDTDLQGRIRTLLMPLTSHFSISKNGEAEQPAVHHPHSYSCVRSRSSSPTYCPNTHSLTSTTHEASLHTMLPPSAFSTLTVRRSHSHETRTNPKSKRLWDPVEVAALSAPRCRTRDSRARTNNQENVSPDQPVAFRQPRPQFRFGICFSRKSSFGGGVRPGGVRSPLNSTE